MSFEHLETPPYHPYKNHAFNPKSVPGEKLMCDFCVFGLLFDFFLAEKRKNHIEVDIKANFWGRMSDFW